MDPFYGTAIATVAAEVTVKRSSLSVLFALLFAAVTAAAQPPAPQPSQPTAPQPPAQTSQPMPSSTQPTGTVAPSATSEQAPAPATKGTDEDRGMMLMLLDRIQQLTTKQLSEESKSGKVTVPREQLDEILANVAQIRTMLQK